MSNFKDIFSNLDSLVKESTETQTNNFTELLEILSGIEQQLKRFNNNFASFCQDVVDEDYLALRVEIQK